MKFQLWTIGKTHEPHLKDAIELFTKRISNYFPVEWKIIQPQKSTASANEKKMKEMEAETVLSQLDKDNFLVLLDENGKQLTNKELSAYIQTKANESVKTIVFLIGGAYGVSDEIMQRSNFKWSLSKLVFPHQLVRLMLAEQLYRTCTILRNEKYHHS